MDEEYTIQEIVDMAKCPVDKTKKLIFVEQHEKELDDIGEQIADMNTEMLKTEKELEEKNDIILSFEKECKRLEKELEDLKKELEDYNNKVEEIIKLIKMKVSQARELGYSYKDLEYIEQKLKEVKK